MQSNAASLRVEPLDVAKGIAAILMVLGHAEIFLNPNAYFPTVFKHGEYFEIERLYNFVLYIFQSSVDGFYFLAGVSLALGFGRPGTQLASFRLKLRKRSLFLIVVDLLLISWSYGESWTVFTPTFGSIASFGVSFWLMSFILNWKSWRIFAAAITIFLARELIVIREPLNPDSWWGVLYGVFWSPVYSDYWLTLFTVASWLPIIMLGFCFSRLFQKNSVALTPKSMLFAALGLIILFFTSRVFLSFGSLGQPIPRTLVQIFQLEKYPASIHFHLLNMGFAFFYIFLAALGERYSSNFTGKKTLMLLGQHIFFVYILHLVFLAIFKFLGLFDHLKNGDLSGILGFLSCMVLVILLTRKYDRLKRKYRSRVWIFNYI